MRGVTRNKVVPNCNCPHGEDPRRTRVAKEGAPSEKGHAGAFLHRSMAAKMAVNSI